MSVPADALPFVASLGATAATGTGDRVDSAVARRDTASELDTQKDNIAQLSEISKNSQTTFLAVILACVYSFLTIATTTDAALLSNSNATALPLLQANVPVVWFYYVAPAILTALFVYFHLYLERFWRGLARLPLMHPDGRGLDDYIYPWLISCALIRGRVRALSCTSRISSRLEAWVSLLLGWGLVPLVLIFYWGRYVVAHDWLGTALHIALIALCFGVGLTFLLVAHNALAQVGTALGASAQADANRDAGVSPRQRGGIVLATALLGAVLLYLSAAAFYSPAARDCEQADAEPECRRFGPARTIWRLGLRQAPHADVKEVRFIPRPANWLQLADKPVDLKTFLEGQPVLAVNGKDLRYMRAAGAFLPGSVFTAAVLDRADLSHADLTFSRFNGVSMRGADLTGAVLQRTEIASSRLEQVSAVASRFDRAVFIGSEAAPMRMSGDFSGASFNDAEVQRLQVVSVDGGSTPTKFIGAKLQRVRFGFASFSMVDFSEALIQDSHIDHGVFVDTDFAGTKIRSSSFNFSTFTRCRFIGTRMEEASFLEAVFVDSEFGNPRGPGTAGDVAPQPAAPPRELVNSFSAVLAKFDDKTRLVNVELRGAELRDAQFTGTRLTNVLFTGGDLSSAHFVNVDFASVSFAAEVDLSGADLSLSSGLTKKLLAGACGNRETKLPPGLRVAPCHAGKRS